jgi:hypothetical protein
MFTERADHLQTPTIARGEVWLANTATQSLMFTDDAGNDWQIGGDTQTANNLTLGDATGSPEIRVVKSAGGSASTEYALATGSDTAGDFRTILDSGEAFRIQRYNASWEETLTVDTGKHVTIYNNLTLNNANPTATFGAGTGSTSVVLAAAAAGLSRLRFFGNGASIAANDKEIEHGADELLRLRHYNGATWDDALTIDNSADVLVENALLVAGAAVADGTTNANEVVIGDGVGARGLTIFSGAATTGEIAFTDAAGTEVGSFRYWHGGPQFEWWVENGQELNLSASHLGPQSNGGLDLGTDTLRYANSYVGTGYFGGASSGDAIAAANDVIVGDGGADRGITINQGANNDARLAFNNGTNDEDGAIKYGGTAGSEKFTLRAQNANRLVLSNSALEPATDGGIALGGSGANGWASLFMQEAAAAPTVVAGEGVFWVQNDAPSTAMYTDDGGDDHPLSLMETVNLPPNEWIAKATGGFTGPAATGSEIQVISWANSGSQITGYTRVQTLPRTYSANGLTVRLTWIGDAGASGNVRFQWSVERHVAGLDISSTSFASAVITVKAGPTATNTLQIDDFTFTNSEIDGLLAGETFRLQLGRNSSHGDDTYAGSLDVVDVQILENP